MAQTDLRVVKTLRQIDHSLLECLADTPFEKITVEQLCRGALINRSTFYKYYTSKYDLMERYLNRALDGFRRQVDVAFVNASPRTIQKLVYQKNFENVLKHLYKHKSEYTLMTTWFFTGMAGILVLFFTDNTPIDKSNRGIKIPKPSLGL